MKRLACLFMAVLALSGQAQIQQANSIRVVQGRGRNADYRMAVYEALVQAMSQVQGVSLQDSRDAFMDSVKQLKSTKSGGDGIDELRESLKQNVSAKTKGRVLGYDILEERHDREQGLWFVTLNARVPGTYTVGLPADNRRRMVVLPFQSRTGEVNVFGKDLRMSATCEGIAAKLNESLAQTRRFTMLDRAFDAQTKAELGRLNLENAAAGDFGRFQQMLVTDYMVVGTVKMFSSPSAAYNPYTGTSTAQDGPFLEVSYRVILAPTTQLKWAGTVIVPYSACRGDSVDTAIESGLAVAAREVCHDIVDNIYPVRVTAKTASELVLNQGGTNIRAGALYDVFRRGETIVDVASGEALGAPEEKIARIRISRVDPKMCYATVVEGAPADQIPVGAVVRRPRDVPPAGAPAGGSGTAVQVAPGGTVVPPWKR
ncbi:MAG: hypothetical protein ACI4Q3_04360 [Kiritimatiellia bacterium]